MRTEPDRTTLRWSALGLLASMQFLLVVDMTVVNIALPRIGEELGFSASGLVWVVDAYALAAGGLLLFGGRVADIVGRRRMFLIGVSVFALGSAVAGFAPTAEILVAGRLVQGVGDALAAPAALGLIVVLFPDPGERTKAIGLWGALAGIGGVTGTVISGVLTDLVSWRLVFLIALPVAAVVLVFAPRLVAESRMAAAGPLRFWGVLCGTAGLAALVYGFLRAADDGWTSWSVIVPVAAGVAHVASKITIEDRSPTPVIPMSYFTDRIRLTANGVSLVNAAVFTCYLFLLSLFVQQVLQYTPLQAGLAYLPIGLAIGIGLVGASALTPKIGLRPTLAIACAVTAAGLALSALVLGVDAGYLANVVPSMVVVGLGQGMLMPTMTNAALQNVTDQDAGLASGVQTTMTHVGGALGLAILVTVAVRESQAWLNAGANQLDAAVQGYHLSLWIAAAAMVLAAVAVVALLRTPVRADR